MRRDLLTILLSILITSLTFSQSEYNFPDSISSRINAGNIDTNLINDIKKSIDSFTKDKTISFDEKMRIIDSVINLSNSIYFNDGSARLYNLKGVVAYYDRKNDIANKSYLQAMKIIKQKGLNDAYFDYYINLCNSLINSMEDSTYYFTNELIKEAEEYNDSTYIGQSYATLARYYYNTEDIAKYINLLNNSVDYFSKDDYENRCVLYINLGIANFEIKDYKKSREYYFKALETDKKAKVIDYRSVNYNNIGRLYHIGFKKLDSAIYFFNKALQLKDSLNDEFGKLSLLINLGNVYYDKLEYDNALRYYRKVESSSLIDNLPKELTANTINIGIIYTEKKEDVLAKEYLNKGLKLAGNNMMQYKQIAYEYLSKIALRENNAKLLNTYKDSMIALQSRLWDEELKDKIADINAKNNLEQLEKDKELLENNNKLNKKKILIKNIILIASIFLISILIILIYTVLKGRKKINKINKKLHLKNTELKKTNNELHKLNQTKNKFFSIIAHDLKGPIGATSSLISQLQSKFDYFDEKTRQEILDSLKKTGVATFELLENLLDWARTQKEEFEYNEEEFELEEVVYKVFSILEAKAKFKNQKLLFNSSESNLKIKTDKKMLNSILVNLVNNAIKFSKENTEVQLSAQIEDNRIQLRVIDEGIGIGNEKQKTLFDIGANRSCNGTNNEKGTGLGLIISKEFSKLMNANLVLEKSNEKGSVFLFELPL